MSNPFSVHHYPVFKKGTFQNNPALFDRFIQNTSDQIKRKYHQVRESIYRYEETITWPLVSGPGFSGGTHPGADNVFVKIMVGLSESIDNGDCLYVNPSQKIFAISDAPGLPTSSRKLLTRIDHCIREGYANDITTIINTLNKETNQDDGATLSLIYFPENNSDNESGQAIVLIAGDTFLFHGNTFQRRLRLIPGIPDFFGTSHIYIEPTHIELAEGDFFIIASDGILTIRGNKEIKLEEALLEDVNDSMEDFALHVIRTSNQCYEAKIYDRTVTRFGGSDNISFLLVHPEKLIDTEHEDSFILGGNILKK